MLFLADLALPPSHLSDYTMNRGPTCFWPFPSTTASSTTTTTTRNTIVAPSQAGETVKAEADTTTTPATEALDQALDFLFIE